MDVSVNVAPDCPDALGDTTYLKLLLKNLVDNSLETFSGRTGMVEISAEPHERDRRMISITVTDDGEGIPEEYLTGPHVPLHTTHSHKTGVGLSISKLIADRHGGSLRIDSERGVGTRIEVTIPAYV